MELKPGNSDDRRKKVVIVSGAKLQHNGCKTEGFLIIGTFEKSTQQRPQHLIVQLSFQTIHFVAFQG